MGIGIGIGKANTTCIGIGIGILIKVLYRYRQYNFCVSSKALEIEFRWNGCILIPQQAKTFLLPLTRLLFDK